MGLVEGVRTGWGLGVDVCWVCDDGSFDVDYSITAIVNSLRRSAANVGYVHVDDLGVSLHRGYHRRAKTAGAMASADGAGDASLHVHHDGRKTHYGGSLSAYLADGWVDGLGSGICCFSSAWWRLVQYSGAPVGEASVHRDSARGAADGNLDCCSGFKGRYSDHSVE